LLPADGRPEIDFARAGRAGAGKLEGGGEAERDWLGMVFRADFGKWIF